MSYSELFDARQLFRLVKVRYVKQSKMIFSVYMIKYIKPVVRVVYSGTLVNALKFNNTFTKFPDPYVSQ